jgi:hypothetical protein
VLLRGFYVSGGRKYERFYLPNHFGTPNTYDNEAKYHNETDKNPSSLHNQVVDYLIVWCYTSPLVDASPPAWKAMDVMPVPPSALATSLA